jgi:hypothetical protein
MITREAGHAPASVVMVSAGRLLALAVLAAMSAAPALAQRVDTARAMSAFREADVACRRDAGALWGRSLCGPIALAERQTRLVLTNDSAMKQPFLPLGRSFVTTAPQGTGFANTSFDWAGRRWAMIMLPLPADSFDRVTLVMHEVFHREQDSLGLAGTDPPNNQLDELNGRVWLRFELQALAAALEALAAGDGSVRAHTEDAMLFRARRRQLYPLADSLEPALEIQEGLAEYTGERLAMTYTGETPRRVARKVRDYQANPTYVRSFAYATGPALGVLLDHFDAGWRRRVRDVHDPARMLATSIGLRVPRDLAREAEQRARRYDYATVMREETARDSARRGQMADYRARLVDGPTVTFTQPWLGRNFNPQTLVGFDIRNTVYPTGTFNSVWGKLEVTNGGALLSNDQATLRVVAPVATPTADARTLRGDGWTLELAPGWTVKPAPGRSGSYLVVKSPP